MYYVFLIHADDSAVASAAPAEIERIMEGVERFDNELTEAGKNVGSVRLRPSSEGRILSLREGRRRVTDGPFAETKEQLGGIYIVEAADMDEAVQIAERLPTATFGSIEIREALGVDLRREVQAW